MTEYAAPVAFEIIETLIEGLKGHIEEVQARQFIPAFLGKEVAFMICENHNAMVTQAPRRTIIQEESMQDVPCLRRDNLMPKEIENQLIEDPVHPIIDINLGKKRPSRYTGSKSISLSSRTNSRVNSLLLTDKRRDRTDRSDKTVQDPRLEMLKKNTEEVEDPELEQLRTVYEMHLQHDLQYKKMTLQHEKTFKEKLEIMNSLNLDDPNVSLTHDFDGQQLVSSFVDDKIKYYSAKAGVGPSSKRYKDGNKTYVPPDSVSLVNALYSKERDPSKEMKQAQMPMFPQSYVVAAKLEGIRSYRHKQYKKQFGRGYSRFDQLSSTIDYTLDKEDPIDKVFSQKKHLNDSQNLSALASSSLRKSSVNRRIALPRIHGRYKVLDRYQSH